VITKRILEIVKKSYRLFREHGLLALLRAVRLKCFSHLHSILTNPRRNIKNDYNEVIFREKIVIFSGVPYNDIGGGQRSAQLTRAALRTGRVVLYVYAYPKYDFTKQTYVTSNLNILNLVHRSIKQLNVEEFLGFINLNTTVIFEIPHPLFVEYFEISRIRGVRTVFELIDDWNTSLGGDWFDKNVYVKFVKECDKVVGTAKVLVTQLREIGREDAIYLPNAANEYLFDSYKNYKRPSDLPDNPIALYFGSLYGEWFLWDYIEGSANNNKGINFCLIGNCSKETPIMPDNVYFLGEKEIIQLPAYIQAAEFCLLPFKTGKLADAVSPIKIFEYLFMAKPVVSTNIAEVIGLPLVSIARTEEEFVETCRSLIHKENKNTSYDKNKMEDFISKHSWFSRLQTIIDLKGRKNISAIILIHNNREIIGRCLSSLIEHCFDFLCEVIVVDNASEDGGGEYVLANFPSVQLIRNPVNGCASGRNLGVNHSRGTYLAFFDADQWFTSGFCFEEAIKILEARADIGAVGWSAGWFGFNNESLGGPIVDYFPDRGMNAVASMVGYRTDIGYLGTGGLFIPKSIFDSVGGFDVTYDPTTFEDTDLSFAIKKMGFKIAYRDLTGIRHEAHQTTKADEGSQEYRKLFLRNSDYFQKKWADYRHFISQSSL